MKLYYLDGSRLTTRDESYQYLKHRLSFPDYFGNNLDALWDVLSERRTSSFTFYNAKYMDEDIRDVFTDSHHTILFDSELTEDITLKMTEDEKELKILGEDMDTTILSFTGVKTSLGLIVEECLLTSDEALLALLKALELKGPETFYLESEALKKAIIERDSFKESKGLFSLTKVPEASF